jgi:N-acetylglucosaminyldiphosphoundecaprenol N-acetyl-beta-D-mannosaminyltransferase
MNRVHLFGIDIDPLCLDEAATRLMEWIEQPRAQCRFVVTPNVDHTVLLHENEQLRDAYRDAALVVADGWPVVVASRLLGKPLPQRVAGSDLVPYLMCESNHRGRELSVYLLGAAPGVAERAAENIQTRWPKVKVHGTYSPPLGFERDDDENENILQRIAEVEPDLLVVGLGAPKQELWVHGFQDRLRAKVAVCAGATIDFLAGEKKRAPRWIQYIGMEWFHRVASEPRRLAKRYARDAWVFPQLVLHEIVGRVS